MNVYDYLKTLAKKYGDLKYESNDDLVRYVYNENFDEIEKEDTIRENSNYTWIYKIDGKFYALYGSYQSHYGTEVDEFILEEVELKDVVEQHWLPVKKTN